VQSDSIRKQMRAYSIFGRRKTTVNHAFASAIAPNEEYDDDRVDEAMRILEQDPNRLTCVYCGQEATGWDHVFSLVKNNEFSGYGHVLRNLVPSCGDCNSSKGSMNWSDFFKSEYLKNKVHDGRRLETNEMRLTSYVKDLKPVGTSEIRRLCPTEMDRLDLLKAKIFDQMKEADEVGNIVRSKVSKYSALNHSSVDEQPDYTSRKERVHKFYDPKSRNNCGRGHHDFRPEKGTRYQYCPKCGATKTVLPKGSTY
jgi:Zn finger protein HypA/HybF involved in hydrogenase expression